MVVRTVIHRKVTPCSASNALLLRRLVRAGILLNHLHLPNEQDGHR